MKNLIFAFMAASGNLEPENLILAGSIRAFAGDLCSNPVWVLYPAGDSLSEAIRAKLASLDVSLIPFDIDQKVLSFPFAGKVYASAFAESLARAETERLVWMDPDTIVIREPKELLLPEGKDLGCRPVHHLLIGSPYDRPPDPFWELIYRNCNVPERAIFPMTTVVDEVMIRPYFNAGLLVVRPEKGLLAAWRDNFQRLYRQPPFEELYEKDERYRIFVHQAALAGTFVSRMERDEIQELSELVNYPLHLHRQHRPERRIKLLNDLVTCRYENSAVLFGEGGWRETVQIREPLNSWLDEQLEA